MSQRATTRNSPKLISQSHVIASTHMTRRHMVQYKSQYRNTSGVLWCVSGDSESKVLEEVVDASTLSASISVGA